MSSLGYLLKCTIKNNVLKALKRPVTYLAIIGIVAYAAMMFWSFGTMAQESGLVDAKGLATVFSLIIFWMLPADIISYARRRGLVFKKSEIHFVFPAPENPKHVLLKASIRNYIVLAAVGLICMIFGLLYIDVEWWRMVLFFLFFGVLENILEGSMIIICYGNQTLPRKFFKILPIVLYVLLGVMVVAAVAMLYFKGFEGNVINEYLNLPVVQGIPFIGWIIAVVHLIFAGPTTLNVICTVCYVVGTLLLFIYACKMECTGEYYEDAMKFAEEYATRQQKAKKGEMVINMNWKKKLKQAEVEYKGVYAKAIYYRQLLEYKKNRFFIFGWNSLLFAGIGAVIAFLAGTTEMMNEFGYGKVFVIPAVIAYVLIIFSGYQTKWAKELENPYTYLIPDSSIKKLWYSTKIEHIRALADGCLITLPGAVIMGLNPVFIILTILLYVCLNANKLYLNMLSDALLGKLLGNTGKTLLRVLFQSIAVLAAMILAIVMGMLVSIEAGFIAMIAMTAVITFGAAMGATVSFDRMESFE